MWWIPEKEKKKPHWTVVWGKKLKRDGVKMEQPFALWLCKASGWVTFSSSKACGIYVFNRLRLRCTRDRERKRLFSSKKMLLPIRSSSSSLVPLNLTDDQERIACIIRNAMTIIDCHLRNWNSSSYYALTCAKDTPNLQW